MTLSQTPCIGSAVGTGGACCNSQGTTCSNWGGSHLVSLGCIQVTTPSHSPVISSSPSLCPVEPTCAIPCSNCPHTPLAQYGLLEIHIAANMPPAGGGVRATSRFCALMLLLFYAARI